jgi:hypothetical protein
MSLLTIMQFNAQTLSLSPTADTYLNSSSASTSFGTDESFAIKHSSTGSNEKTAWIKFDLPSSTTSTQILLKLVQISGDNANVTLTSANTSFTEAATWNSPPTDGTTTFAYGGYRVGNEIYYDITDYVKTAITAANTQIGIKLSTTSLVSSAITFGSRENTTAANQPKLLFYDTKVYDIPLFKIEFDSKSITAEDAFYTVNTLDSHNNTETYGTYLGWTGAKAAASGYFKVEKDCDGVWNMFDPEGYMFYSAGLNSIEQGGGVSLPSTLTNLGLNTMGNWSDETISNMPFCARLNFIANFTDTSTSIEADFENNIMPVFEPTFESFCTSWALSQTASYLNNKWLIGYFMDNELNFHKTQLTSSLALSTSNAQYQAADTWMKAKYGDSYTSENIAAAELDYMGYVIETYYRIVYTALKAADPNHLVLGSRFHSSIKYTEQAFTAIQNYVDVFSVNYYGAFEPDVDTMAMWLTNSEKPFIISEFYAKGDDSGLSNADGAGWDVATQQERQDWFVNWMTILLQNKGNVGFHWFRYMDNNDSNKGLYSTSYVQYTKLADAFKLICSSKYRFRSHVLYGNANYNGVIDCDNVVCGSNTSCITTGSGTAASDFSDLIVFYPNPVSKTLYVSFENATVSPKSVEIISVLGALVKKELVYLFQNNLEIDMTGFANGVYFVKIIDQNNDLIVTKKIIIAK